MTRPMRRGVEVVVAGGATAAINFAYLVYAGRKLGPDAYADFWAAMSLLFFGTLFLNPLAPFAAHVAARALGRGATGDVLRLRRMLIRLTFGLAVLLVAVAAAARSVLASFFHLRSTNVVLITVAAIAAYAVLAAERGLFQGLARFREFNVNAIVETVVRMVGAVAVLAVLPTASAALACYLAGLVVALALLLPRRVAAGGGPDDGFDFWQDVRTTGVPMFLLMAGMAVFQNADSLAVKRWLPLHDASSYAAAAALSRTFTALATPLWILLVPAVASALDARRAALAALRICGAYLALSVVIIAAFTVCAVPLYAHLYGPAFLGAAPLLAPLSGVIVLVNTSLLLAQALVGMGRRTFLYAVMTLALVEIITLSLYHPGVLQIIAVLYFMHAALALLLAAMVLRAARS